MDTIDTYYLKGKKWVIDVDADSQLDFSFDWTKYLLNVDDTIATALFLLDPLLTQIGHGQDGTHATAWIAPGPDAAGLLFLTCRITTNNDPPRIDDRTVWLNIVSK